MIFSFGTYCLYVESPWRISTFKYQRAEIFASTNEWRPTYTGLFVRQC